MTDVLIVVDVQRDFCEGGSLAVPRAHEVVPRINELMRSAELVIASKDWHPPNHCSFKGQGGMWPAHCVWNTDGSMWHPDLDKHLITEVVHKGMSQAEDDYSAFGTGFLGALLKEGGVEAVTVVGLATDYCVMATALDGLAAGYGVNVDQAGCRGFSDEHALEYMASRGCAII